jgi:multiple sugar transport system ATP-binding protein
MFAGRRHRSGLYPTISKVVNAIALVSAVRYRSPAVAEIVLDGVTKAFGNGEVIAVDDVSLEIESGEFLVLVGPSGCGKSTLLRMIAGLEDVSGGAILIDGRDVTELPPRSRDIAMVFRTFSP